MTMKSSRAAAGGVQLSRERPTAASATKVTISVVMPAHNEADFLETSVQDVLTGLRARAEDHELIIVENGSVDGTAALAARLASTEAQLRVLHLARADYGAALRAGLLAARGEIVVNFDVDYYDLGFLDQALACLRAEPWPAIVVGSKRAPGAQDTRSSLRRLVTWGFGTVLRVGFRLRVSDTHGMKAIARAQVAPLVGRCRFDGDLFDTELVIRAQHHGLVITELPVTVSERRPPRTSIARRVLRTVGGLTRLRIVLWRERSKHRRPGQGA
jgi:glycosyltransferase involved in cell wall biosynthesis